MLQSETDITRFQDQGVDLDEDDADADLLFHGDDALFADFRRCGVARPLEGGGGAPRARRGSARADA
ncbi:hypothetical protein SO694_00028244 [Aureococcus anophagefferens]|uniref:Uncharacterized protein n=1 Tax=Aureococcus anophagefferens TaxID=44056 RepID=A0ABR1FVS9_AURAN